MLTPDQNFAHFKIIQKLGEGGMGEVYLAEDLKLNRRVALKTLRDDYFDNQERRDRFEREAKTAAQISHANVMAIYDIGTAVDPQTGKSIGYIVMEYIQGRSLSEVGKSSLSDIGALLRLAEKIASGLAAAHRLNIVHRDIKAENILVDEHGEPKILDFGLAKAIEPLQTDGAAPTDDTIKRQLTTTGTVVGTVSYMSPEQVRGEPVDNRSDIFSFGILLFKMFTGELPFAGSTQVSILAKILEAQHPAPRTKNANIDPEIERIIDKCLQKNANDRYQDTRDLVVDLRNLRRQYDSGISSSVSSVGVRAKLARGDRDKRGMPTKTILGVVLFSIIGMIFLLLFRGQVDITPAAQAGPNGLAILGFENKTGDAELDWLKTGLPEILLTDLAQDQSVNLISPRRIVEELGGQGDDLAKFTYEDQVRASRKLGAVNVLSGTIFKLGNKIRIDARLEDVTSGKIVLGEKVVSEDPMTLVDSLAVRMATALNMRRLASADQSVAQVTTASTEAYKYYHLGMQKFLDELYDEAEIEFQKAVAIDSSFALAYMRIGMSYVFGAGRIQDAVPYFTEAQRYESRLPNKERGLLDVYAEIWQKQNFDLAMAKMKTLVDEYPDDEESKTVYALLRSDLLKDTAGARQLYEEVLQQDPKYQLALSFVVQYYQGLKQYDKAIEYGKQLQQYHPDSPASYRKLAQLYLLKGDIPSAIATYDGVLKKYPGDGEALMSLSNCAILQRDFAKADSYAEDFRKAYESNPYQLDQYYRLKANLAMWSGKFRQSLAYRYDAVRNALLTKDSLRIVLGYQYLSRFQDYFGFKDSAYYTFKKALPYATQFQKINYPVDIVTIDRKYANEVRPMLERALNDFRARVPAELAPVGLLLRDLFDGYAAADTGKILDAMEALQKSAVMSDDGQREFGEICIFARRYEKGKGVLTRFVEGSDQTVSGYYYPLDNYLMGIANEALGDKQAAVKYYREMLRYWSNPDIEISPIKDAKSRLARLAA